MHAESPGFRPGLSGAKRVPGLPPGAFGGKKPPAEAGGLRGCAPSRFPFRSGAAQRRRADPSCPPADLVVPASVRAWSPTGRTSRSTRRRRCARAPVTRNTRGSSRGSSLSCSQRCRLAAAPPGPVPTAAPADRRPSSPCADASACRRRSCSPPTVATVVAADCVGCNGSGLDRQRSPRHRAGSSLRQTHAARLRCRPAGPTATPRASSRSRRDRRLSGACTASHRGRDAGWWR